MDDWREYEQQAVDALTVAFGLACVLICGAVVWASM